MSETREAPEVVWPEVMMVAFVPDLGFAVPITPGEPYPGSVPYLPADGAVVRGLVEALLDARTYVREVRPDGLVATAIDEALAAYEAAIGREGQDG